jgi:hypothetical protein
MKRKPRRSAVQWAELVREFRESGESEAAFCARKDLTVRSLRRWRHERSRSQSSRRRGGFVRVVSEPVPMMNRGIVIEAGEGLRIECPPAMSVSAVAALVRELRDGR